MKTIAICDRGKDAHTLLRYGAIDGTAVVSLSFGVPLGNQSERGSGEFRIVPELRDFPADSEVMNMSTQLACACGREFFARPAQVLAEYETRRPHRPVVLKSLPSL